MMFLLYDGKLHLAPIHNPHRVLDIGAGSGIWCIDFADIYPSAELLGVDLSANLPTYVPPNVRFEVDDLEDDWTFSYPFDYIHSRYMAGSIKDWPRLMKQCFESVDICCLSQQRDLLPISSTNYSTGTLAREAGLNSKTSISTTIPRTDR